MKLSIPLLMLPLIILFACTEKTENVEPKGNTPYFLNAVISGDNTRAELWFSEPVFKGGVLNQPLTKDDFIFAFTNDGASLDSLHFFHQAGESMAVIELFTSGLASGEEVLTIAPATGTSVVNGKSVPMKPDERISLKLRDIGLTGNWLSAGENLSVLFRGFGFDSVFFNFKADSSYVFRSKTAGGIVNTLTGRYLQRFSGVEGIRIIQLEQQTPVPATIEGIFSLENGNPVRMTFETVQTSPQVQGLTPPVPELGFGSSGMVGSDNTQIYERIR